MDKPQKLLAENIPVDIEALAIQYADTQRQEDWNASKIGYMAGAQDFETPVQKLMAFAIQQTSQGNHFFFNFSGHVNTFSIWGYRGAWNLHKDVLETFTCNVNDIDDSKAVHWMARFNCLINE